ncbi:hypothetical protein ABH926_002114 [Catenulispora sp. GP43]|uniref:hypothetical protein n=1 Tax=Catenulispora sp. GP43 TaxID=3156263 RepID=UPI003513E32E
MAGDVAIKGRSDFGLVERYEAPTATTTTGSVGSVGYAAATGIFTVTVTAATTEEAVITITP